MISTDKKIHVIEMRNAKTE